MSSQARTFFVALLILALAVTWLLFRPYLTALVLATFAAVLAMPLQRRLAKRMPGKAAAALVVLAVLVLVTLPLAVLGYLLVEDARDAAEALEDRGVEERFRDLVRPYISGDEPQQNATMEAIWDRISDRGRAFVHSAAEKAPTFIVDLLLGTGVMLFAMFFLLSDADRLIAYLHDAVPLGRQQIGFLLHQADQTVHAIFFGQIVTGVVQGLIGGIGFWIAGLPGVMLWTFAMAVLSILPIVGAFLVWVPAALFLFAQGQIWQAVFLTAWGLIPVSLVDNILRPILIGGRAGLHPLLMLIAVLGGVEAFGPVGLIMGPLIIGVTVALLRVWRKSVQEPVDEE